MIFYPSNDRILVELIIECQKTQGLYLPEDHRKRTLKAIVVRLGKGEKSGELGLDEGDRILIDRHAGIEIKVRANESDAEEYSYILISPSDILGYFHE
jgi:chaperonin GroES